eukprot:354793-Chlamydomonas_euryale.AAC.1
MHLRTAPMHAPAHRPHACICVPPTCMHLRTAAMHAPACRRHACTCVPPPCMHLRAAIMHAPAHCPMHAPAYCRHACACAPPPFMHLRTAIMHAPAHRPHSCTCRRPPAHMCIASEKAPAQHIPATLVNCSHAHLLAAPIEQEVVVQVGACSHAAAKVDWDGAVEPCARPMLLDQQQELLRDAAHTPG